MELRKLIKYVKQKNINRCMLEFESMFFEMKFICSSFDENSLVPLFVFLPTKKSTSFCISLQNFKNNKQKLI